MDGVGIPDDAISGGSIREADGSRSADTSHAAQDPSRDLQADATRQVACAAVPAAPAPGLALLASLLLGRRRASGPAAPPHLNGRGRVEGSTPATGDASSRGVGAAGRFAANEPHAALTVPDWGQPVSPPRLASSVFEPSRGGQNLLGRAGRSRDSHAPTGAWTARGAIDDAGGPGHDQAAVGGSGGGLRRRAATRSGRRWLSTAHPANGGTLQSRPLGPQHAGRTGVPGGPAPRREIAPQSCYLPLTGCTGREQHRTEDRSLWRSKKQRGRRRRT